MTKSGFHAKTRREEGVAEEQRGGGMKETLRWTCLGKTKISSRKDAKALRKEGIDQGTRSGKESHANTLKHEGQKDGQRGGNDEETLRWTCLGKIKISSR
jgi:hypothetical protein